MQYKKKNTDSDKEVGSKEINQKDDKAQTISVVMVVKNEAAVIERSIANASLIADEIIVVDTGSTDNTIELASSFKKVKLFEKSLDENLGAARNLSLDKATCDWVIILDADEYVDKPREMRMFFQNCDSRSVYLWSVYEPGKTDYQLRAWRRGAYRFKWRIHTQPESKNGYAFCDMADFRIINDPPANRQKVIRLPLLLMDIVESNDRKRKELLINSFHGNYSDCSISAVKFFSKWIK